MGCVGSKLEDDGITQPEPSPSRASNTDVASKKKMKHTRKSNGGASPTNGRGRADTWEKTPQPTPEQQAAHRRTKLEQQWKQLWKSHVSALLDPADIPAVLEQLMNSHINRLSATQYTFIQRRIRTTLNLLPKTEQSSKFPKVTMFNSSTTSAVDAEARALALKSHVIAESVLRQVLPPSDCAGSIINLMIGLSDPVLWERTSLAATEAAKVSGLEMDVNKLGAASGAGNRKKVQTPKPSELFSVLKTSSSDWFGGASPTAVAAVLGMAVAASRTQRLQLLFYSLIDETVLRDFLASHPAGGIPLWLLEVDANMVISLPSLTHYHYYGSAFLPCSLEKGQNEHVPSKSREPITIEKERILAMLRECLVAATVSETEKQKAALPQKNGSSATSDGQHEIRQSNSMNDLASQGLQMRDHVGMVGGIGTSNMRRSSRSTPKSTPPMSPISKRSTVHLRNGDADIPFLDSLSESRSVYDSSLMRKLRCVSDGIEPDPFFVIEDSVAINATVSVASESMAQKWTLHDFNVWAKSHLDDLALDVVMHRLFVKGILPSPTMELDIVKDAWLQWQSSQTIPVAPSDSQSVTDVLTNSVTKLLNSVQQNGVTKKPQMLNEGTVWGGLGGIDGLGGMGLGVLYCIPKLWWDTWTTYAFPGLPRRTGVSRPYSLSTNSLIEQDSRVVVKGTLGSYELMRTSAKRGVDFVLVPPGVWDVLYELYGGGPPLPRMVKERGNMSLATLSDTNMSPLTSAKLHDKSQSMSNGKGVLRIPDQVAIETFPLVLNVHICDPLQPYRRGETGLMSIRAMASPAQPLWRLMSEIACRIPLQSHKSYDPSGRGKARLWRKSDSVPGKDVPLPRYGPWNLLCKNRHALLPVVPDGVESEEDFKVVVADWKQYTGEATVADVGLLNDDTVLFEFAVLNKVGELVFPREAAAKAGKVRRIAEEDRKFRQLLLGTDEAGSFLVQPHSIVGLDIDALDPSGRWYTVKILDVRVVDNDTDEETDDSGADHGRIESMSTKNVKVSFQDHGGHGFEWIDVESDRLQTAGRFASEADQSATAPPVQPNGSSGNGERSKSNAAAKKSTSNAESVTLDSTKACPLPGFGSCGLTNLGNTCYMNSAVQCMAYLPLLRSYLLSAQYKATGDLNKDNPLGTGGKLLEEFAELIRAVWSTRFAEKSPNRFRQQLGKTNDQFAGADQQDAQEFLNYMIDVLHEDSNKVRKKPYVESLEDRWVENTKLSRVGDEAWRRFLRRNRSIMADVAMGQALNTVTCPVCRYSSRNFDPFNLLSIPIPTVADVLFQCTVIRRGNPRNCGPVLNKARRSSSRPQRFSDSRREPTSPPYEGYVAEQYVIALSRLADSGDIRLQIQNLSGIRANQLRLCRVEEVPASKDAVEGSSTKKHVKIFNLIDKEGPASQHVKKRAQGDDSVRVPTQILAFESTINPRNMKGNGKDEETDDDDDSANNTKMYPSRAEKNIIEKYLKVYGDEKECRVFDTDPIVIAKAMSRSLWPRADSELKIGLRVDAKDHQGKWFPGSVVDVFDDEVSGGDADTGQEVPLQQKKVKVHFDNFLPKWDETYTIEAFKKGRVAPLYSHAEPKAKVNDSIVLHRHTSKSSGQSVVFGQEFYIQFKTEWTNARAGAHILAQASRFLQDSAMANESHRLAIRMHALISELMDVLIDADREYVRLSLGVSNHCTEEERDRPYRNPKFDPSSLIAQTNKKVASLVAGLPFEIRLSGNVETVRSEKTSKDELLFPFVLNQTIGNFLIVRNAIVLEWKERTSDRKNTNSAQQAPPPHSRQMLYEEPNVHVHVDSAEILKKANKQQQLQNDSNGTKPLDGTDFGFCLTEFCKVQKLPMSDNWTCPRCKVIREGGQNMNLWRLPDLLTFHMKRFNMSARWHEKITTKVNFPMTGLDMSEWCHPESPVHQEPNDACVYDLIGVMNHYGSMTGGHYVATCKATLCGQTGKEEVAYPFNGVGVSATEAPDSDEPSGWTLGRGKPKVNQSKVDAAASSRAVADSAEPLWLQFDDELVEAIPPRQVVSEMAYVLFYRRRRLTPANVAKYSTLD